LGDTYPFTRLTSKERPILMDDTTNSVASDATKMNNEAAAEAVKTDKVDSPAADRPTAESNETKPATSIRADLSERAPEQALQINNAITQANDSAKQDLNAAPDFVPAPGHTILALGLQQLPSRPFLLGVMR
jgi:hypothetical protein